MHKINHEKDQLINLIYAHLLPILKLLSKNKILHIHVFVTNFYEKLGDSNRQQLRHN